MEPEMLKKYLEVVKEVGLNNANIHLHFYPEFEVLLEEETWEPPTEEPTFPSSRLVIVTEQEAFKEQYDKNTKGKPILRPVEKGWHTNPSERYLVFTETIQCDGGELYHRIYKGPYGLSEGEQIKTNGLFLTKSKIKYL